MGLKRGTEVVSVQYIQTSLLQVVERLWDQTLTLFSSERESVSVLLGSLIHTNQLFSAPETELFLSLTWMNCRCRVITSKWGK